MYSVCVCVCVKCTRTSDKNLRNKSSTDWTFFVFRYHDFPCICFSVFSSFSEISCPILTYTRRYKQNLFNHTLSKNLTFLFPCLHKLVSYVKVKSNLTCALFADTNVSAWNKDIILLVVHAHRALIPNILVFRHHATTCVWCMHTHIDAIYPVHTHTPSEAVDLHMCCIIHKPWG